jgi:2-polyprenyl-3-methyl-5-hydroxy-6-metoxy-1,4-benzoquinol methylase
MPFDHNDRYHRLLLRQVPAGCRTALDVGCGTGRFARRLARRGIQVDAIDRSAEVIRAARAA